MTFMHEAACMYWQANISNFIQEWHHLSSKNHSKKKKPYDSDVYISSVLNILVILIEKNMP